MVLPCAIAGVVEKVLMRFCSCIVLFVFVFASFKCEISVRQILKQTYIGSQIRE